MLTPFVKLLVYLGIGSSMAASCTGPSIQTHTESRSFKILKRKTNGQEFAEGHQGTTTTITLKHTQYENLIASYRIDGTKIEVRSSDKSPKTKTDYRYGNKLSHPWMDPMSGGIEWLDEEGKWKMEETSDIKGKEVEIRFGFANVQPKVTSNDRDKQSLASKEVISLENEHKKAIQERDRLILLIAGLKTLKEIKADTKPNEEYLQIIKSLAEVLREEKSVESLSTKLARALDDLKGNQGVLAKAESAKRTFTIPNLKELVERAEKQFFDIGLHTAKDPAVANLLTTALNTASGMRSTKEKALVDAKLNLTKLTDQLNSPAPKKMPYVSGIAVRDPLKTIPTSDVSLAVGFGALDPVTTGQQGTFMSVITAAKANPFGRRWAYGSGRSAASGKETVQWVDHPDIKLKELTPLERELRRLSVVFGLTFGDSSDQNIKDPALFLGLGIDVAPEFTFIAGYSLYSLDGVSDSTQGAVFIGVALDSRIMTGLTSNPGSFTK